MSTGSHRFGGSVNVLHDGGDHIVAGELERVIVGADGALEQVDNSRSVASVEGRPQGGSLLVGGHLSLRSITLP
ncbi:MAG: hypothetical protein ACLP0J_20990 [Solirubrobacteraceae bacterium]